MVVTLFTKSKFEIAGKIATRLAELGILVTIFNLSTKLDWIDMDILFADVLIAFDGADQLDTYALCKHYNVNVKHVENANVTEFDSIEDIEKRVIAVVVERDTQET